MEKNTINLSDASRNDDAAVLRHIAEKSKLNFLALSHHVSISFSHFLNLIKNHDLEKVLKNQEIKQERDQITIPSSLLVEVTGSEYVKQKKSANPLSGVFLVGILLGCVISIFTVLILLGSQVEITASLLTAMGFGFLAVLFLVIAVPMLLTVLEPFLKRVQQKHHDFMERFFNLFQ